MKNYLLCYDISDEKRLAKLSHVVEKEAFRIQRSIFLLFEPTMYQLESLICTIQDIIDSDKDDVRLYTIKQNGFFFGCGYKPRRTFYLDMTLR